MPVLSKQGRNGQLNPDDSRLISDHQSEDDDDSLILTQTEERVSQPSDNDDDSSSDSSHDNEQEQPTFQLTRANTRSKYESLDYDVSENKLWEKDQKKKELKLSVKKNFSRWILFLLIGGLTGMVGTMIFIISFTLC